MKRSIATAAVCGASLFGFTAVAGAAPPQPPNGPNPSDAAIDAVANTACNTVIAQNPTINGTGVPGTLNLPYQFDSGNVGHVFCLP
jgi:hypothetical protein